MARITVSKPVDPAALKATLGVDVFTSQGDDPYATTRDVIADVDEATLQSAVDGYTPPPDPDDELDAALAAAAAKTTVEEKVNAVIAALRGTAGRQGAAAGRRP